MKPTKARNQAERELRMTGPPSFHARDPYRRILSAKEKTMRHISTATGVIVIFLAISSAHAQNCGGQHCLSSEFCQLPEGVCDPEQMAVQGICVEPPLYCYDPYEAVCGCDGITYENECTATQWHRSIDFQGECPAPEYCGGFSGNICYDPEEYCYMDGCCCDLPGQCIDIPAQCPTICNPVCGCDAVTSYLNRCEAEAAPSNVMHAGDCDEIPNVKFVASNELIWWTQHAADSYNLYRKVVVEWPPQDYGQCLQEGISSNSTFVNEEPASPGELWLLLLTGQYPAGEGSMGRVSADCSLRVPEAACGSPL
jgi:hypothetical protein